MSGQQPDTAEARHQRDGARHGRLAIALTSGAVLVTLLGVAAAIANGTSLGGSFLLDLIIVGTAYSVVGGILLARVPANRVGWLLLAAGWVWSLDLLVEQYARYGSITAPSAVPAVGLATWLSTWLWIPGNGMLFFGVPLLFPDGRLPSRRWLPAAVAGTAMIAITSIAHAMVAWPIRDTTVALQGGYDASAAPGLLGIVVSIGDASMFLVLPFVGLAALAIRYRSSHGIVREQLRWVVYAVSVTILAVISDVIVQSFAPGMVGLLSGAALTLLPAATGIAILRYRLYDIDRIISRTLAYALISAVLLGVYAGGVLSLSTLLEAATQGQSIAVAASTLAAFAVFQPVRRWAQQIVDRRFYRSRFDAERTSAAFSQRLRDQVDIEAVSTDLTETVQDTIRPEAIGLWLRDVTT